MDCNRRSAISAIAAAVPATFSTRVMSQASCGAGLVLVRVEVRREIAYVEGEVSIAKGVGGSVRFKAPVYMTTMVAICEPPKPPPPVKDRPRYGWGYSGGFSYAWFEIERQGVVGYMQGFSVRTRLPSFTRLSSTSGRLTLVAGLTDGTTASISSTLRHNGSEFRVSDTSGIGAFADAYASRLSSLEQRISDIEIEAFADGADTLGIDTLFQNQPLQSRNQLLHVSSGGSTPPGFFDPQGAPIPGR